MGIALTAAIASGFQTHQACVHGIVQVAFQNAILNQNRALAGVAFIVHVKRTTPISQCAVVQHRHTLGGHPLAHAPTERAGAFAVEVAFQTVAYGLVQQNTRPAGAEYHGHFARWGRARIQIRQRRSHRFVHVFFNLCIVKIRQPKTPTATGRSHLTATFLFGNHGD